MNFQYLYSEVVQWIRSPSFKFQIAECNYRVQIQPVPINKFSHITSFFFYLFMYGVLQGDNLWDNITYFHWFSIRDSLRVHCLFLSDKKRQRNFLLIYMNISQKSGWFPIPSLRIHDLLKILEHALSLLDEFFYTSQNF